jgi:hypothetical protein
VLLPNYYGAKFDYAAVESYLRGQNTFTTFSASDTVQTGGGYVGGATCTWP